MIGSFLVVKMTLFAKRKFFILFLFLSKWFFLSCYTVYLSYFFTYQTKILRLISLYLCIIGSVISCKGDTVYHAYFFAFFKTLRVCWSCGGETVGIGMLSPSVEELEDGTGRWANETIALKIAYLIYICNAFLYICLVVFLLVTQEFGFGLGVCHG